MMYINKKILVIYRSHFLSASKSLMVGELLSCIAYKLRYLYYVHFFFSKFIGLVIIDYSRIVVCLLISWQLGLSLSNTVKFHVSNPKFFT